MVSTEVLEKTCTIAAYLDLEDAAELRHEFNNGTVEPMAGGTIPHNAVKGEIYTNFNLAIRQGKLPHVALNSDTKVRIERKNRFVYPDVTVTDEMPEYYITPEGKTRRDIIINPLLVVEVLSEETRDKDKGEKFEDYSTIPGFREYLLLEPETVWAKLYFLHDPENNLWQITTFTDLHDTIALRSLPIAFQLSDIYAVLEKLPKGSAE